MNTKVNKYEKKGGGRGKWIRKSPKNWDWGIGKFEFGEWDLLFIFLEFFFWFGWVFFWFK